MYLYRRGKGASRRVMHLAKYTQRGEIAGAVCGTRIRLDTSINVPLARPICKKCRAMY